MSPKKPLDTTPFQPQGKSVLHKAIVQRIREMDGSNLECDMA